MIPSRTGVQARGDPKVVVTATLQTVGGARKAEAAAGGVGSGKEEMR